MKQRLARIRSALRERVARTRVALQERRRKRELAQTRANALIVDDARDAVGRSTTSYWWAYIPLDQLELASPLGHGRYVRHVGKERIFGSFILMLLVGASVFLCFAAILFLAPNNPNSIIAKLSIAGFWGMSISIFVVGPVVYTFRRKMFRDTLLYVIWRVSAQTAAHLGISPRPLGFIGPILLPPYVLLWAEPSLYATDIIADLANTLKDMQVESTTAIWQMEMLNLGVDGFATERFLRGLTGAKGKEELLKGRGLPGSVDRTPADSSQPDSSQVPGTRRGGR